jgi:hypothetical protein
MMVQTANPAIGYLRFELEPENYRLKRNIQSPSFWKIMRMAQEMMVSLSFRKVDVIKKYNSRCSSTLTPAEADVLRTGQRGAKSQFRLLAKSW